MEAEIGVWQLEDVVAEKDQQRQHGVEVGKLQYPCDNKMQSFKHSLEYRVYTAEDHIKYRRKFIGQQKAGKHTGNEPDKIRIPAAELYYRHDHEQRGNGDHRKIEHGEYRAEQ